jgi:two-component system NarL family sensor kinase
MLLMPVIAGQAFLVLLARRTRRHQQELHAAEESERRRIARDLHDTVVQVVAGWSITLAAESRVALDAESSPGDLRQLLTAASDDLRGAARDLRTLIVQIAPASLHEQGLGATLDKLLVPLREAGVDARCDVPEGIPVSARTAELIFRVAQEAIRNVAAHADAGKVELTLQADGAGVRLTIIDDGSGFTPGQVARRRAEGHVGTHGMRELAENEGASLAIHSDPRGTRVTLAVPKP